MDLCRGTHPCPTTTTDAQAMMNNELKKKIEEAKASGATEIYLRAEGSHHPAA